MATTPSTPVVPQVPARRMLRFRINRHRRLVWTISLLACGLSLMAMAISWSRPSIGAPLRPGLDFTGGTQIQLERVCDPACDPLESRVVQERLAAITLPESPDRPTPDPSRARIQIVDQGRTLVLRLPALAPSQSQAVITALSEVTGPLEEGATAVDTIGPTLGAQLLRSSLISLLVSFAGIAVFISVRYDRLYAGLALFCLGHDVLIICGLFAWLGLLAGIEVDSLFAVSLLTIAGYSVNDTVVVFDRIREQRQSGAVQTADGEPNATGPGEPSLVQSIDTAVSATFTRTIYTSTTTLLPLLALILFGGSTLVWFGVALASGVVVGSWSSIAIAPTLLALLQKRS
ncbi:protein translocase subunit SecF [Synechococcus sp. RSCCF101]|uniref:protein translocase subunit SecF n=1 Tax=Synechococcus sp. RSCCF101 TaxID=2511069 RepID=UPI001243EAA8|nr:protein translocase subunit SecF [Synechococcus sp. RSCCF101]QEY31585.1 protein translocase subunit SecF [Synechococcus sp. RSCCF101]